MTKKEVLELLQSLLAGGTFYSYRSPDDYSGVPAKYFVDHKQLCRNIEKALEEIDNE